MFTPAILKNDDLSSTLNRKSPEAGIVSFTRISSTRTREEPGSPSGVGVSEGTSGLQAAGLRLVPA